MTHEYELMVILDPEIDERAVAPSLDKFLNVIRNDGGTIDKVDIWGKRRLAYEIQKKTEGIYAVVNFTATSESTVELDRQLKLSEAVMRTKVLRAEEAVARATAVHAEDAKRAERKAAAIAKNPKAAAEAAAKAEASAKAEADAAAAKAEAKAKSDAAKAAAPAAAPAAAEPAAVEAEAPAADVADEAPAKPAKAAKAAADEATPAETDAE
jgi:small subunit ribosomal protein S6